jgi:hypothetical protein
MPTTSKARPGAPIPFEAIPPQLRSGAIDAYLYLLDHGYDPDRIAFLDHGDSVRVEGTLKDGTSGTSCPVTCHNLAPEPASGESPSTEQQRDARRREREGDLRPLIGRRVRIRWPNGHQRIGVVAERTDSLRRPPPIVLEEQIVLRALEDATAVDELAGTFKPVATASDWTAR